MSNELAGKTAWEFACEWYTPGEIAWSIARHKNGFGALMIESPEHRKLPTDVYSQEFAEWLTEQYRLAMAKGIDIGEGFLTTQLASSQAEVERLRGEVERLSGRLVRLPIPKTSEKKYCDRCDGCGWYEGGPTLMTQCEVCDGTGVVSPHPDKEASDA